MSRNFPRDRPFLPSAQADRDFAILKNVEFPGQQEISGYVSALLTSSFHLELGEEANENPPPEGRASLEDFLGGIWIQFKALRVFDGLFQNVGFQFFGSGF